MSRLQTSDNRLTHQGEINRAKLLSYLTDFDNEWPKRQEYSILILGYKNGNQIYRTLSPKQVTAIEAEALETIKEQSTPQRKKLYQSLFTEGKNGNVTAIKEFLDRTEGKVPDKLDATLTNKKIIITRKSRDGEDD